MKFILSSIGWCFANIPDCIANALCVTIGWIVYAFPFGRVRVARRNLSHAFPEMSESERNKIAFESSRRMVEMAMFVVASPMMSAKELSKRVQISDIVKNELAKVVENPRPTILMIPHFAMMETITMFPMLVNGRTPQTAVFYRPFDMSSLESWVKSSRKRFGLEMLSRRTGMHRAVNILRNNGCVAILFDQKVLGGSASLFFDRVCFTSELAGILAENTHADIALFWASRTGFWRSRVDGVRLSAKTIEEITVAGNEWLADKLRSDQTARFDWLWMHQRWLYSFKGKPLRIIDNKKILEYSVKKLGLSELPRNLRVFVRAPETLDETVSIFPILAALRKSRPDSFITLLCPARFVSEVRIAGAADEVVELPDSGFLARAVFLHSLRKRYPDYYISFDDSVADDAYSFLLDADCNFAMSYGRRRRFARFVYKVDAADSLAVSREKFLQHFGMCDVEHSFPKK